MDIGLHVHIIHLLELTKSPREGLLQYGGGGDGCGWCTSVVTNITVIITRQKPACGQDREHKSRGYLLGCCSLLREKCFPGDSPDLGQKLLL